jgi:Ca2+-binding RTX toxin-like protein
MSCELDGEPLVSQQVFVARGESATVDWRPSCAAGRGPNPVPKCRGTEATLVGTVGNDRGATRLIGTSGRDVIVARRGNDVVRAGAGKDIVCGGPGNDRLVGGKGQDVLRGAGGADVCPGSTKRERRSCKP